MESKRKLTILFLCAVVLAVAIFGVFQFSKLKKTITVNVTDLNTASEQEAVINNNELDNKQSDLSKDELPVNDDKKESVASEQLSVVADKEVEKKQETKSESVDAEREASSPGKIVQRLISWGFTKSSGRKIDTIIVHSSYDALGNDPYDVAGIIAEYKQYGVSAHYLIARDGTIYQLVDDQNIAWHAGVSVMPDGRKNVNDFSIGVEMINTQEGKYTNAQYDALNSLIATLKKKYSINDVLGHDDIAPGRKTDPWGIDWKKVNR